MHGMSSSTSDEACTSSTAQATSIRAGEAQPRSRAITISSKGRMRLPAPKVAARIDIDSRSAPSPLSASSCCIRSSKLRFMASSSFVAGPWRESLAKLPRRLSVVMRKFLR